MTHSTTQPHTLTNGQLSTILEEVAELLIQLPQLVLKSIFFGVFLSVRGPVCGKRGYLGWCWRRGGLL